MRIIICSIVVFLSLCTYGQQQLREVKTKVNEVTIFSNGAQIVRKKQIEISKGITELKFKDLSPYINSESIHLKAISGITILSVSHQINFLDKLKTPSEIELLNKTLETLENQIKIERTHLSIIKENIDLLQKNKDLSGKNNPISATNLQQVLDFYNQRITDLKFKENERNNRLVELIKKQHEVENQKSTISGKLNIETSEIVVKINSEKTISVPFELSYVVENASWTPSYDLRTTDISRPITLIYKANVKQDTKEDWENVKLKLSSANPYINNDAPELKTYFLGYNTRPPSYQKQQKSINSVRGLIQGIVVDQQGEPLPGVSIIVKGKEHGVSTDFDGKFSISAEKVGTNMLEISSIGFKSQLVAPKSIMTIQLEEDNQELEEVVMTGYAKRIEENTNNRESFGEKKIAKALNGNINVVSPEKDYIDLQTSSTPTNIQFEIMELYSIKSNNQNYVVEMQAIELPTDYQYHVVPKVESTAFLLGYVTDWEKYNLLEGEAAIFFEDTYVGKTQLSTSQISDTLKISLGQDSKVSIQREKVKDFDTKQFIGNRKEVSKLWKITIRNNKNQPIKLLVFDQIPVSTNKEIEVITKNISNGKLNKETGIIQWFISLQPTQKQELELEYIIKYPKDKTLYIE
ncbi:mucoidy inhibitor MuiA family protein [Capnocytophaga catalasegens]|uniref:Membrane protein n=1 Tax=Capnocytophaga catalasegens TaxID=1004260 RepID=A0AAV5AUV2_9FLAO|nr:mucoidy inhibitor MuiA family protein [Capnocytophaga catalasegens]GIZ15453.1 membrane protein [Capnocytophaga catalasegens]GJM51041.1 membrane protein [Capnocytophaga catalasegens]GJM52226.1 membrane protein [Capnocytophaga catalasegens]